MRFKKATINIIFFFIGMISSIIVLPAQPNILWITIEDISPTLSMYGDSTAKTPNLDALAAESTIYENAFSTVGVCAPARSSIITGMQPTAIGTMHMRTGKDIMSWGKRTYRKRINAVDIEGDSLREYAAVLPKEVKCFTEYLRAAGYYCTNNAKTDYQFAAPLTAWDENDNKAHWRNCPKGQPFFSVFNFNETHESKLWKYADKTLTVNPESVPVPPYFPDTKSTRQDIARHYSNIEIMDKKVGKLIAQLKADGLYEEAIIFFFSDHGGPLPRQKREIYDTGLHVPFMIKMPQQKESKRTDRLISFTDLAPTVLSLANITAPDYMQGRAFTGEKMCKARDYVLGSGDRFDEYTDRSRMIRTKDFLYVRHFFPEKEKYKDVSYRAKNVPMMSDFLKIRDEGQLTELQQSWFEGKPQEELFMIKNDPHNMHNLADVKEYQDNLLLLRQYLRDYLQHNPDLGQMPEAQLIDLMWENNTQTVTATPKIEMVDEKLIIKCSTPGASIAYFYTEDSNPPEDIFKQRMLLYTKPIPVKKGKTIFAVAERIGYRTSVLQYLKL